MNRAPRPNPRTLLTILTFLFAFSAATVSANPYNPPPQYQVLLFRGTVGGSATGQWAVTQLSYPNPRAAGIVGAYVNIQEVPGLSVSWSTPGATMLQAIDWNTNPKERLARAAFQYNTAGTYTATCTLSYDDGQGGTATVDIPFLVVVIN